MLRRDEELRVECFSRYSYSICSTVFTGTHFGLGLRLR